MVMLISYDLCGVNKNYEALYNTIRSFPKWVRLTESAWVIDTSKTCLEVANMLIANTDDDDRVFVGELSGQAAWRKVMCGDNNLRAMF